VQLKRRTVAGRLLTAAGLRLPLLQSHRHGLSERAVALIAFEVLKVVAACHSLGILHGDIKPANFVLKHGKDNPVMGAEQSSSQGPWLKAIDFGCGQVVDGGWYCLQRCAPQCAAVSGGAGAEPSLAATAALRISGCRVQAAGWQGGPRP
jgi:serine/threonine protein kinase